MGIVPESMDATAVGGDGITVNLRFQDLAACRLDLLKRKIYQLTETLDVDCSDCESGTILDPSAK